VRWQHLATLEDPSFKLSIAQGRPVVWRPCDISSGVAQLLTARECHRRSRLCLHLQRSPKSAWHLRHAHRMALFSVQNGLGSAVACTVTAKVVVPFVPALAVAHTAITTSFTPTIRRPLTALPTVHVVSLFNANSATDCSESRDIPQSSSKRVHGLPKRSGCRRIRQLASSRQSGYMRLPL
jgi:hypothetical protein